MRLLGDRTAYKAIPVCIVPFSERASSTVLFRAYGGCTVRHTGAVRCLCGGVYVYNLNSCVGLFMITGQYLEHEPGPTARVESALGVA